MTKEKIQWQTRVYQSGSTNVESQYPDMPFISLHYAGNIAALGVTECESDRRRAGMADDVASYLNGGERPEWLNYCGRGGNSWLRTPLDGRVSVIGPMALPDNDNGRLSWRQDESIEAEEERKRICGILENGGNDE